MINKVKHKNYKVKKCIEKYMVEKVKKKTTSHLLLQQLQCSMVIYKLYTTVIEMSLHIFSFSIFHIKHLPPTFWQTHWLYGILWRHR